MKQSRRGTALAAEKMAKFNAPKTIKDRFMPERKERAKPVVAKTQNQKTYLKSLQEDKLSVGKGSAGSGKTYCAAAVAANKYLLGEIDTIVLTRPYVGMGKSSGFWPGTIRDKLEPYMLPMLNTIKERIGVEKFEADFGKGIVIQPLESVRGQSFANTFLIVDEAQNLSPEEARSLVTRMAEGSQIAFCGDDKQKDIQGLSGIEYIANLVKTRKLPGCSVVEFTPADNVRSGLSRMFVEIFESEGAIKNVK